MMLVEAFNWDITSSNIPEFKTLMVAGHKIVLFVWVIVETCKITFSILGCLEYILVTT